MKKQTNILRRIVQAYIDMIRSIVRTIKGLRGKRNRRIDQKKWVKSEIFHVKYSIINLTLRVARGDMSETGYLRRVLNRGKLLERRIRYYESLKKFI